MCGIAGIATTDGSTPAASLLKSMTDAIAHRGPDGEGQIVRPGVGFGHRRLSIIDLAGGVQPMADPEEQHWITFNGEIYNFLELRPTLEAKGHRLTTRSDTEVLLRMLADDGAAALPRLRGMFAFGFWNARSRQLLIARDRLGKKPVYWFEDRDGVYFASEIKALLTLPNCPTDIDATSLDYYLAYESVPGPRTIFRGIQRLPPASVLTWSPGQPARIDRYWEADWSTKTTLSYADACHQLRGLIVDATRARLISDVPVGAFLSGGVDSSVVVAAMAEVAAGEVKTFSIGFTQDAFNETRYARMVAQQFGTTHEEFTVEPDAVAMLPKLAWHYDQPFSDSSALPTYYVSQLTRQRVTVALNGDGGDEFFGGYERYRALLARAMYHASTTPLLRNAAARLSSFLPGTSGGSLLGKLRFFSDAARGSLDTFNLRLFHHRQFEAEERRRLYTSTFAHVIGPSTAEQHFLHLMADSAARAGRDVVDHALRTDTLMYLPDTLLPKVDIASMSVGLEGRSPLLDTSVVEFAASLPRAWKVSLRQGKRILKDAHRHILPHEVLYRRKMGFSVPLKHWFEQDLYGYTRDLLLDRRTVERGYFDRAVVEQLIEDHRHKRRNNAMRLWALVMLEHWHREVLDARSPSPSR